MPYFALLALDTLDKTLISIAAVLLAVVVAQLVLRYLRLRNLKNKNEIFATLFESVPGGLLRCCNDEVLTLSLYNSKFPEMIGYGREDLASGINRTLINVIYKNDLSAALRSLAVQLKKGDDFELKLRLVCKDDSLLWVQCFGRRYSEHGTDYLYCVLLDYTEAMAAEQSRRIDEEKYRILATNSESIIFEYEIAAKTVQYSPQFRMKFQADPITENVPDAFFESNIIHPQDTAAMVQLFSQIVQGAATGREEVRIKKLNGEYIWCRISYALIYDEDGKPMRAVGKITDIDKQKRETENLIRQNQLDSFTGLYNKTASMKLIDRYIKENNERKHALFFIDVDNFKAVNDTHGHLFGDSVLLEIAQCIRSHFRFSDIVGRIGGDEFVVLLKDFIDEDFIAEKAAALLKALRLIRFEGKEDVRLTVSIGIALFPKNAMVFQELAEMADIALYDAKTGGKNKYRFFISDMAGRKAPHRIETDTSSEQASKSDILLAFSDALYSRVSMDRAVTSALSVLGKYLNADRVAFFEHHYEKALYRNTFEWCETGIKPRLDGVPPYITESKYISYSKLFDERGIFHCRDTSSIDAQIREGMRLSDVQAFVQCCVQGVGVHRGFICLESCNGQKIWSKDKADTLIFATVTLEKFISEARLSLSVHEDTEHKKSVIDESDIPAFVADAYTLSVLYMSRNVKFGNVTLATPNIFKAVAGDQYATVRQELERLRSTGDSFVFEIQGTSERHLATVFRTTWTEDRPAYFIYIKTLKKT